MTTEKSFDYDVNSHPLTIGDIVVSGSPQSGMLSFGVVTKCLPTSRTTRIIKISKYLDGEYTKSHARVHYTNRLLRITEVVGALCDNELADRLQQLSADIRAGVQPARIKIADGIPIQFDNDDDELEELRDDPVYYDEE